MTDTNIESHISYLLVGLRRTGRDTPARERMMAHHKRLAEKHGHDFTAIKIAAFGQLIREVAA